ncbi:hypothetical protein ANCCAN_18023 [Ancylostoma caninum]|uniref:Uncharacterized protein n=1 Tax=Ancylostoma caninum TaxID=29170 RepID=A0A368FZE4_ANCCA|nr:hypothetical protein ANCCAN_18023 [Ancylostoma caninum]
MDFFDIRKLTAGQPKDFVATGDGEAPWILLPEYVHPHPNCAQTALPDYSAVAFLPVIMIGAVVLGICGVCQYKKWKHEKKQIAHLNNFYEILEESKFEQHGKMVMLQQNGLDEVCHDRIRRAMLVPPPDSSPFFQPAHKTRAARYDIPQKATTATEIIFHFTNLNAESRKISIDNLSESEIEYIV